MKRIILLTIALLSITATAFSASLPEERETMEYDTLVTKGILENGLTCYIRPDDINNGFCNLYLIVDVGSLDEEASENGYAHFVEHMCFKGTSNFKEWSAVEYLENKGLVFGSHINGFTTASSTSYIIENLPSDAATLDSALLILRDFAGNVTFGQKEVEREAKVIIEEKRFLDSPQKKINDEFLSDLYNCETLFLQDGIGSEEQLRSTTSAALEAFYKKWYVPGNMAVVVIGDVETEQVYAKIKELFSTLTHGKVPAKRPENRIPETNGAKIVVNKELLYPLGQIVLTCKNKPHDASQSLLDNYQYPLFLKLVENRFGKMALKDSIPLISVSTVGVQEKDAYSIFIDFVAEEDGFSETLELCMRETERIKRYGFFKNEISDAVLRLEQQALEKTNSRDRFRFENNFLYGTPIVSASLLYQIASLYNGLIKDSDDGSEFINDVFSHFSVHIYYAVKAKEKSEFSSEREISALLKKVESLTDDELGNSEIEENTFSDFEREYRHLYEEKFVPGIESSMTEWKLGNGIKVVYIKNGGSDIELKMFIPGGISVLQPKEINIMACQGVGRSLSGFRYNELQRANWDVLQTSSELHFNAVSHEFKSRNVYIEYVLEYIKNYFSEPVYLTEDFIEERRRLKTLMHIMENSIDYYKEIKLCENNYCNGEKITMLCSNDVDRVTIDEVINLDKALLRNLGQATLYIKGGVEEYIVRQYVAEHIASVPTDSIGQQPVKHEFAYKGKNRNHIKVPFEKRNTSYVFQDYDFKISSDSRQIVLLDVVSNIMSRFLYNELSRKAQYVYGVECMGDFDPTELEAGCLSIKFKCHSGNAKNAAKASRECLEMLAKGKIDEEAIAVCKKQMQNFAKYYGYSDNAIKALHFERENGCKGRLIEDYEKVLDSITSEEIFSFCRNILKKGEFSQNILTGEE